MAETTTSSATTAVTDRRPVPLGVVPRRMQTWIMAGLAGGMLLIMFIVGRPQPASRTTSTTTPTAAPSPDRLRDYQDRLRVMEARAAQEAQAAMNASAAVSSPAAQEPPTPAAATTPDPIQADRKRRAYESLFASNVVLSRRPADQQPSGSGNGSQRAATPTSLQESAPGAPPNLDDVASAVVRATARYGATAPAPTTASTFSASAPPQASVTAGTPASANGRRAAPSTDPISPSAPVQRLLEGTVIDTVLTNRLDGATASPVNCLVTHPIYSLSGQHVLIPAGSRLLGETKAVQSVGESRLAVAFHRLLFPDGRTVSLDQFTGLNQRGDAALSDQANHHYGSMFGAAAAVGLVSGLGQAISTVGNSGDRTIVFSGGLGNATSEATAQVMNRFLNRLPTLTIREGHRVEIYLTGDLELPVYEARPIGAPSAARVP